MTETSPSSQPPTRFCTECGAVRQGEGSFCISCGTRFAIASQPVEQDLVARALDANESVRETATRQIIETVDTDAMTRCGNSALEQGNIQAAEFWFMEVATAEADDTIRAEGIEDLCRLVYLPIGRLEEAELYARHAAGHPDPKVRARALRTLADIEAARSDSGLPRLEYSEAWRRVDVTQPMPNGLTQVGHYQRLIAYMFARDEENMNSELLEGLDNDYMQCISGLLNGLDRSNPTRGMERDTAAKAVSDWLAHR